MGTREALDRAIADQREAAHLDDLLRALRGEHEGAVKALETARRRHGLEEGDVRALQGVRLSALLAAVRGTRRGELDRERAEEVAARYAVESAVVAVETLESRRVALEARLAGLGDTAARRERAAQEHAEALRAAGADGSPTLERVLDDLTAVRAERVEVDEALAAGRRARNQLDAARRELGSADSWSAYDTWFGGGMISSAVKHDRIDTAAARIGDAQRSLADFSRELADVSPTAALGADLGITPTTRTLDIWFDNLFTDLSVRSRIKDSLGAVDAAVGRVDTALSDLTRRSADLARREADLCQARDAAVAGTG